MPLVAVIPEPNAPVELREVPLPDLENDSALFEVELSEVCGTDVYLQQGRLQGVPYPLVPGHVSVGRLSKIRGTLRDVEGREFRGLGLFAFLPQRTNCFRSGSLNALGCVEAATLSLQTRPGERSFGCGRVREGAEGAD